MDKRSFLKTVSMAGFGLPFSSDAMDTLISRFQHQPALAVAADEEFWSGIRRGYKLKPEYINLENGYYNILPEEILQNFLNHVREVNYQGSYYMRTVQFDNKKTIAGRLASLAGCNADELIITRNTT